MEFYKSKFTVGVDQDTGAKKYITDVTCVQNFLELDDTLTNKNVAHFKFLFGMENELVKIVINKQFYASVDLELINGILLEFAVADTTEAWFGLDREYILNNVEIELLDFNILEGKL